MVIGDKAAERILQNDLAKFEARVEQLVKVPLTDNQFAVLVSFDFNTGALHKSTLLRKLNKGDYAAVPGELAIQKMGAISCLNGFESLASSNPSVYMSSV